MTYVPAEARYDGRMPYRHCGRSGLKLPGGLARALAQFRRGHVRTRPSARSCAPPSTLGITHFDLANNYGPPPGSAETAFGEILRTDFAGHRDELVISTKAGYRMWAGPYGEWGSRKYLLSSLDQSLKRMGLDYVDIFYSHRFDPDTPLEETMGALDTAVRSGKALYAGISSYNSEKTRAAAAILKDLGTPLRHPPAELQHAQPLGGARRPEGDSHRARRRLDRLHAAGPGHADREVPRRHPRGQPRHPGQVAPARRSSTIARSPTSTSSTTSPTARGQTLAQMAIAWVLRAGGITSALIGASRPAQVEDCVGAVREPRLHRRGTRRDRSLRQRGGDQPLGKVLRGALTATRGRARGPARRLSASAGCSPPNRCAGRASS